MDDIDLGLNGTKRIHLRGIFDAGYDVRVRPRTDFPTFVNISQELAVTARSKPDAVPGLGSIGGDGETLGAGCHQLDRSVQSLGRKCDQGGARRHRAFRTKSAANVSGYDAHFIRLDAKPLRDAIL